MLNKPPSNLTRGVLSLMMGAGTAKFFGVLAMPILTRIYSVEDIGILTILNSIVMLIVPILTLQYVVAIPLPRTDTLALHLVLGALILAVVISAVLLVTLISPPVQIYLLSVLGPTAPYLWITPLMALGMATHEIFTMWLVRKRQYKSVAHIQMSQTILGESTKILLGALGFKPIGLMVGQLLNYIFGAGFSFASLTKLKLQRPFRLRARLIFVSLQRYKDIPLLRLPAQFLLVYAMQTPLLFAALFYSTSEAAYMGMATMALSMPFTLIGQAASRVYYAEIAALGKSKANEIRQLTIELTKTLILVSAPLSLIIYLFGEYIFTIVFGPEWSAAGRLASILSIFLVFQFCASPLLAIFNVFEAHGRFLGVHAQRAVLITIAFAVSVYLQMSLEGAITIYTILLSLHYLGTALQIHFFVLKKSKEQVGRL